MRYLEQRTKIVNMFRRLDDLGLNAGRSGNISMRAPDDPQIFLITPSGVIKRSLKPEEVLVVDANLDLIEGDLNPSVESSTHLAIYKKRTDVKAIIHAHAIHASAFAVVHKPIPPILEETVYYTGGNVEVAEFAQAGSDELAKNVLTALGNKKAVLLSNHGIICCGKNLEDAFEVLQCVERAAKVYLLARLLGEPALVPEEIVSMEKELYEMKNQGWD